MVDIYLAASQLGKWSPLATDTEVNTIKTVRSLSSKMMIFNSFTVANDYNFGAQ